MVQEGSGAQSTQRVLAGLFVMYCRLTALGVSNSMSAWTQYPVAFNRIGFRAKLIVGRAGVELPATVALEENGITGQLRGDICREFFDVIRSMNSDKPTIAVANGLRTLFPITVLCSRIFERLRPNFRRGRARQYWVLKLDWDGIHEPGAGFWSRLVRTTVLVAASYVYDLVTIETSCGFGRVSRFPLINRPRLFLLANAVPYQLWPPIERRESPNSRTILSVARVSREKGLEVLVRALAKASSDIPGWRLRVVGEIQDREYLKELRDLAQSLGLERSVEFAGHVALPQLVDEYDRADIFCLPTLRESFGNARIEALARATPVITTDAGCGIDFERYGAVVVPAGDSTALANAIVRIGKVGQTSGMTRASMLRSYEDQARELVSRLESGTK